MFPSLALPTSLALPLALFEGGIGSLLMTLVVGGLIGWVASIIMKTNAQMGIVANVIVGVVGAVLASWLAPMVGISVTGFVGELILSVAGAVLCIIALRFLGIFR